MGIAVRGKGVRCKGCGGYVPHMPTAQWKGYPATGNGWAQLWTAWNCAGEAWRRAVKKWQSEEKHAIAQLRNGIAPHRKATQGIPAAKQSNAPPRQGIAKQYGAMHGHRWESPRHRRVIQGGVWPSRGIARQSHGTDSPCEGIAKQSHGVA